MPKKVCSTCGHGAFSKKKAGPPKTKKQTRASVLAAAALVRLYRKKAKKR